MSVFVLFSLFPVSMLSVNILYIQIFDSIFYWLVNNMSKNEVTKLVGFGIHKPTKENRAECKFIMYFRLQSQCKKEEIQERIWE